MSNGNYITEYYITEGGFFDVRLVSKKELLQREFIEITNRLSKNRGDEVNVKNVSCYSKQEIEMCNTELEKTLDELRKDILRLKKDNVCLKQELKKSKDTNTKLKQHRYDLIKKNELLSEEINSLNNDKIVLQNSIQDKSKEIARLSKELDVLLNSNNRKRLQKLSDKSKRLAKNNSDLKSELKETKKMLHNYQMFRDGTIESSKVEALMKKLNDKDSEIKNLNDRYNDLLKRLRDVTLCENKEVVDEKRSVNINESNCLYKNIEDDENTMFGYLMHNESNVLTFRCIDGKNYDVKYNEDLEKNCVCVSGAPVKVKMIDETRVSVIKVYDDKPAYKQSLIVKKIDINKVKLQKTTMRINKEFAGKKVLLVGQMFKDIYTKTLRIRGADVVWHEAYSDNPKRLKGLLGWADVVVICTSHCPHAVINIIEAVDASYMESQKYQLIELDNARNVIHRVRYALENIKK